MEDYCNSMHWKRSLIDSPLSGKESAIFGPTSKRPGEGFQFGADNSFGFSISSPFDWNDEQLIDLIKGENGDSGDHVVPHPYQSEGNIPASEVDVIINQCDPKTSNVKPVDRKKRVDLHNIKHAANETLPASPFVVDSWPDLSLSNTTKVDQDLLYALEFNNAAGTLDGTGELDSDSGFFQNLDVDMDNMEVLDDLDKILSNDYPDFCQTSLPSTQKLGLASKDVTSIPEKSIPLLIDPPCVGLRALRSMSDKSESKAEYILVQNQHSTRGCDKMNDITTPNISQAFAEPIIKEKIALEAGGKAPAYSEQLDSGFAAIPNSSLDEVFLEGRSKSEEEHEANQLQDLFRYWPMSFDKHNNHYISINQTSPSVVHPQPVQLHYNPKSTPYPSVVLPQPMQLHHNLESMPYPGPKLASSEFMDFTSQYTMPVSSQFHDEQGYHQSVPCTSYVSPPDHSNFLKMSSDRPMEGLVMTPKKKIEKLRRQQQMRAMVAIQKLQQQFCDQVVSAEHSVMARGNFFAEEKSYLEQNDSNIVSIAGDDHPVEESILHQLQEIILKLDTRMKLNIRDSFFRLARNARQRQYANNTGSVNKDSSTAIVNMEDINSKVETETNQIDRAVAHFLFHDFHQPLELPKKVY